MSTRSIVKLDTIFEEELKIYQEESGIITTKYQNTVNYFLEALDRGLILELIRRLCKDEYTGVLEIDIVRAAFYANQLAHLGKKRFFDVKSKLLEYLFENEIWGKEPYNSFGIDIDEFFRPVAYFDVPGHGQVSFHLVDVNYDEEIVPKYEMEWCKTINYSFPSYKSIDNYHDLIIALGYGYHDSLGDAVEAITPIDITTLDYHTSKVSYFVGLDLFYDKLSYYEDEEEKLDFEYLLKTILLREVEFSKENRIESERYISDNQEKIEILKKCKDKEVQKLLNTLDQER